MTISSRTQIWHLSFVTHRYMLGHGCFVSFSSEEKKAPAMMNKSRWAWALTHDLNQRKSHGIAYRNTENTARSDCRGLRRRPLASLKSWWAKVKSVVHKTMWCWLYKMSSPAVFLLEEWSCAMGLLVRCNLSRKSAEGKIRAVSHNQLNDARMHWLCPLPGYYYMYYSSRVI